MNFLKGQELK